MLSRLLPKLFAVLIPFFLVACGVETDPEKSKAKKETQIFKHQIRAMDKAKKMEDKLRKSAQQRGQEIDRQGQ